jgi:CheY-like chemotaxis protein
MPATDEKINHSGSILLVDDQEMVLEVGKKMLQKLDYTVFVARSGPEAVEVFAKKQNKIDLVILDMRMPNMNGGVVYDRLKKISPDVKVLISSGYIENNSIRDLMNKGCEGFIQKPFSLQELSERIKDILVNEGNCSGKF